MSRGTRLEDAFFQCRNQLVQLVARIVPRQDVEDIVQETFLRATEFGSKNRVRNPSSLLRKVAKNLSIDFLRRAGYRLADDFDDDDPTTASTSPQPSGDPLRQVISDEEFSKFCLIVRDLPQQQQKAFILRKIFGYSQREIAAELGIAEGTVEIHIARAMKHCVQRSMDAAELRAITDRERKEVSR